MIGFYLPPNLNECPEFWLNFRSEVFEILDGQLGTDFMVATLRKYNAKALAILANTVIEIEEGTNVRDFNDCELKYFVSFENEAQMVYFKMEWS